MDKTKGVMAALKGRKGFGSKKGVNLLGIVQKLTAKRKAMGGDSMKGDDMGPMMKKVMARKKGSC
jgi:hypothetical protein